MDKYIAISAFVLTLAVLWFSLYGGSNTGAQAGRLAELKSQDRQDALEVYRRYPVGMSFDAFLDVRAKSVLEKEQFGDGKHAPHYGGDTLNGSFTLYRGVWVDDADYYRVSASKIDAFREQYWREHKVITYTLVEGEQEAPMGTNGAMMRVRVQQLKWPADMVREPNTIYSDSISVERIDPETGAWSWWYSGTGSTGVEYSKVVKIQGVYACRIKMSTLCLEFSPGRRP